MEQTTLTNMCRIFDKETGCVLVQNRIKSWKGFAYPGGHIEPGEAIVDSVVREVREETGLTLQNLRLCGVKDWCAREGERYIVFLFTADAFTGTLLSRSEEGENRWVNPQELGQLPLASTFLDMQEVFTKDCVNELFFIPSDLPQWEARLI